MFTSLKYFDFRRFPHERVLLPHVNQYLPNNNITNIIKYQEFFAKYPHLF